MDIWIWLVLAAAVAACLTLDFVVFGRKGTPSVRSAALWSAGWLAVGVGAVGFVWWLRGGEAAGEYLAGYLLERSLSIDNVFVFALLFAAFAVPAGQRAQLLSVGILIALALRIVFIAAGAALLDAFHPTVYLFGAILLVSGVQLARGGTHAPDPERSRTLRALRRVWPAAPAAAAVVVMLAATDLVFAVDSIPAIFAVTDDTLVVVAANAFALAGLRALYFLLEGMLGRFRYLDQGLAAVLVLIGAKMLATDLWKPPVWVPLLGIVAIIGGSIALSLLAERRDRDRGEPADELRRTPDAEAA